MKASKFSDAQKAFILKQGDDGVPVAEICRKAGISQATYFNWRKKYAGLLPDEMRRLKALEGIVNLTVTRQSEMLCICRRSYPGDFRVLVHCGGAQFAMVAGGNVVAGDVEEVCDWVVDGYEALQMSP